MAKKENKKQPLTMKYLQHQIEVLRSVVANLDAQLASMKTEITAKKMCINVIVPEKKSIWQKLFNK